MAKKLRDRAGKKAANIKSHAAGGSVLDKHPLFSLRHLSGNYCVTCCDKDHQAAFAVTLHKLSQLTWKQLFSADRHGVGFEKITHENIHTSIPTIASMEKLLAFRYNGKHPMVGFQEKEVFHVLWLDRDFTLYDH